MMTAVSSHLQSNILVHNIKITIRRYKTNIILIIGTLTKANLRVADMVSQVIIIMS